MTAGVTRESFDLEFKESFHFGDSLAEYVRSMVGMANNRGGKVIFGVKNSPRIPIGLKNDKFQECDQNILNKFILEYFSHDFEWELKSIDFKEKEFGQITIKEHNIKPIICRKTFKNILREGAIYYRYRGETKEIKFSELNILLENERKKERTLWMQHIEKISAIGPQNAHFLDTYKGEMHIGNEKVLIDKTLLNKIKFIKEGQFVEREGAPALTLAGKIMGFIDTEKVLPTDKAYPYLSKDIERKFNLNRHQVKSLLWKMNIKNNPRYHDSVTTGKNSVTQKYSESLILKIDSILKKTPKYVEEACREYQNDQKKKRKQQKKKQ